MSRADGHARFTWAVARGGWDRPSQLNPAPPPEPAATRVRRARARASWAIRCSPSRGRAGRARQHRTHARLRALDRVARRQSAGLKARIAACWDHRPIGKNCQDGRLGGVSSHFLLRARAVPDAFRPPEIDPIDATLSVTKAARLLGVHPNTVRAWSDAGRLRYYRINPRGDRRYRLGDLQRFLSAAAGGSIRELPGAIPRRDGHRAGVSAGSPGLTDLAVARCRPRGSPPRPADCRRADAAGRVNRRRRSGPAPRRDRPPRSARHRARRRMGAGQPPARAARRVRCPRRPPRRHAARQRHPGPGTRPR